MEEGGAGGMSVEGPYELPKGWEWTKIGEIAWVNYRDPSLRDLPDDLPVTFVPMAAVDAEKGVITQSEERPLGSVRKGFTPFSEGDVLFAKITPSMENGKSTIALKLLNGRGFGSTEFHVLKPENSVRSELLLYFVRQEAFRRKAKANFTGTAGQMRVPPDFLRNHLFPLPPHPEQRRIVTRIEELFTQLDAGISALKTSQAQLKRYRQSVLKAAVEGKLTEKWRAEHPDVEPASALLERIEKERRAKWEEDELAKMVAKGKRPKNDRWKQKYKAPLMPKTEGLPGLPEGWEWAPFSSLLIDPLRNGHSARASKDETGIRTLTLSAVTQRNFSEKNTKVTVADPERVKNLWIKYNDIFIERANTIDYVGLSAIYLGQDDFAIFPDLLIRARVASSFVSPIFAETNLRSPKSRKYFKINAQGISGNMPKIDQKTIEQLPVPLPPLAEQHEIVSEIERRLSVADQAEATIAANLKHAARLRQSILKKAFRGELVPQDTNDEPASILLERIRAERAKSPPKKRRGRPRKNSGQKELI